LTSDLASGQPERMDSWARLSRALLVLMTSLAILGAWGVANAQSFTYRPLNGYQAVPFVLRTHQQPPDSTTGAEPSEFPRDPFGNRNPGVPLDPGTPSQLNARMAANLRQRFRIIGGPYVRAATMRFSWFFFNALPEGGVVDQAQLQWFSSSPATLTGGPLVPANLGVGATGTNSLMWPGMIFHTVTGPDLSLTAPNTTPDRESWGYVTQDAQLWGSGALGAGTLPTLGVYDQALAVLQQTDDTVDTLIANTGHPVTIAVWPHNDTGTGLGVWARCGALPTATQHQYWAFPTATAGAWLDSANTTCPTGQALHLTVTNTAPSGQVARIYVASHRSDREINDLRIGIAWNATSTQLTAIRAAMRQAAWMFYGTRVGTYVVRSFSFYINATAGDDGWPVYDTACGRSHCSICLNPSSGNANYVGNKIFMYLNPGATPEWQLGGGDVTVHELLHVFGGLTNGGPITNLGDEYANIEGASRQTCQHSWMGVYTENQFTACTPSTHRATGLDWLPAFLRSHRSSLNFSPSGATFSHPDPRSNWQEWADEGRLVVAHPTYQTPHVLRMRAFRSYNYLGYYNQLQ